MNLLSVFVVPMEIKVVTLGGMVQQTLILRHSLCHFTWTSAGGSALDLFFTNTLLPRLASSRSGLNLYPTWQRATACSNTASYFTHFGSKLAVKITEIGLILAQS